jgi:hypothetical protein
LVAAFLRARSRSAIAAYSSWWRMKKLATGFRSRRWNHQRGAKFSCSHQYPIANPTLSSTW